MTDPRHVVVLATQCDSMQRLPTLEGAASQLYDVLVDPDIGGCVPGLPDDRALLAGRLGADEIRARLRDAVDYARLCGAVLVVALLGHGFVAGNTSELHLLAAESGEEDVLGAVNLSQWFAAALNSGLPGLIGIVDTCSGAGALPASRWLLDGPRRGQTRLALLAAAGTGRAAYDLRLTTGLTALMRQGLPTGPERVDVRTAKESLNGLGAVHVEFGGDPVRREALWLCRNWAAPGGLPWARGRPGPAALRRTLAAVPGGPPPPSQWSRHALAEVGRQLSVLPDSPQVIEAAQVAEGLGIALAIEQFLRSWLPGELGTRRLRRAATAAVTLPGDWSAIGDAEVLDVLEGLALSYPQAERTCRPQIARFVAALGAEAGKDLVDLAGSAVAQVIGPSHVDDAVEWARQRQATRRLRLVVSLHAALGGSWPAVLETWLLLDGAVRDKSRLPCTPQDRSGVEQAIARAVDEAERTAVALGLPLQRVDVAVPTHLLPKWRPERIKRGEWLGVRFDVVTRWSERLSPPESMQWIRSTAQRRLTQPAPVERTPDWLGAADVSDLEDLEDRLTGGAFDAAVVLSARPLDLTRLLPLLLAHVPIVLWPDGTDPLDPACREALDRCWPRMPTALLDAYRHRWRREQPDVIADLRVVWDDLEWLSFCMAYHGEDSVRKGAADDVE